MLFSRILDGAGRKSIGTKRKLNSNKLKRQVTAYTCFVAENYELIRKNHDPSMGMKDAITLIARQWAATSDEEKQVSFVSHMSRAVWSTNDDGLELTRHVESPDVSYSFGKNGPCRKTHSTDYRDTLPNFLLTVLHNTPMRTKVMDLKKKARRSVPRSRRHPSLPWSDV